MNPRLKRGGLHLGASRCNRPLDCFGPRDIDGGVPISVVGMAALLTDKGGLTLAVGFGTVSTLATRARRITRVDRVQWDTSKSGLVGKEETELSKRPGGMARTLRVSNRAFRALTDVP